jgi:hypothetical protein
MAIAMAIVNGGMLHVKDERGQILFSRPLAGGELMGYRGRTVTIRVGRIAYILDESGRTKSSMPV